MILKLASRAHWHPSIGTPMRLMARVAPRPVCHKFAPCLNPRFLHMTATLKNANTDQTPFARSHLTAFFAKYPDFKYDPSKPFMDEFWRLVDTYKLGRRGKRYKLARKDVKEAILLQFKDIYGAHSCNIDVWHQFFDAIGVKDRPRDVGLCYHKAKSIHLNICDLIDQPVTGVYIKKYPNILELSDYTFKDPGRPKIVPPISKKQDPIVGRLFRQVTNPPKPKSKSTTSTIGIPATATRTDVDNAHL